MSFIFLMDNISYPSSCNKRAMWRAVAVFPDPGIPTNKTHGWLLTFLSIAGKLWVSNNTLSSSSHFKISKKNKVPETCSAILKVQMLLIKYDWLCYYVNKPGQNFNLYINCIVFIFWIRNDWNLQMIWFWVYKTLDRQLTCNVGKFMKFDTIPCICVYY